MPPLQGNVFGEYHVLACLTCMQQELVRPCIYLWISTCRQIPAGLHVRISVACVCTETQSDACFHVGCNISITICMAFYQARCTTVYPRTHKKTIHRPVCMLIRPWAYDWCLPWRIDPLHCISKGKIRRRIDAWPQAQRTLAHESLQMTFGKSMRIQTLQTRKPQRDCADSGPWKGLLGDGVHEKMASLQAAGPMISCYHGTETCSTRSREVCVHMCMYCLMVISPD